MKNFFIILFFFVSFNSFGLSLSENPFKSGKYIAPYDLKAILVGSQYYVSLIGDDGNNGLTLGTAWRTNVYAAAHTVSGDNIYTQAGTFNETAQIVLPAGVTWHGIDSATTKIRSNVTGLLNAVVLMSSVEGTNGNQSIYDLGFDGQSTNSMCISIGGRSNVIMFNCSFRDYFDLGVTFAGRNDITGGPPSIYATGNKFYNNRMLNCAGYQHSNGNYGLGCLNVGGQTGMLIYSNYISQNQRPWGYNGWPIKGANEGWLNGLQIYSNTLIKIPFGGTYGGDGGWDFCIELFNEQGLHIYNNIIQGAIDMNYQIKGAYAYSVWIHDNTIQQQTLNVNYESGIVFEYYTEYAVIEKNVINKVAGAIQFNTRTGNTVSNITIRENLISNLGRFGLDGNNGVFVGVYNEGSPSGSYNVNSFAVYNNTMVADPTARPHWGLDFGGLEIGTVTGISITNNIIMNCNDSWLTSGGSIPIGTLSYYNNDLYQNGFSNNPYWNGSPPTTLTSGSNISANPLFVSSTDYHVTALSPCINAGLNLGLGTTIGYWQYGTPPPPVGTQFIINRKIIYSH